MVLLFQIMTLTWKSARWLSRWLFCQEFLELDDQVAPEREINSTESEQVSVYMLNVRIIQRVKGAKGAKDLSTTPPSLICGETLEIVLWRIGFKW